VDVCVAGGCGHAPALPCPAGQVCTSDAGCAAAPTCSTTQQCVDFWKNDGCKTSIACEPTTATCSFKVLDNDGDGHFPIVCGGDDCDDSTAAAGPGQLEVCDGKDNDCNGGVDDGAMCTGSFMTCQVGTCACDPAHVCPGNSACIDFEVDPYNCGSCAHVCTLGSACAGGTCAACPANQIECGGKCRDSTSDRENCGGCGVTCAGTCVGSQCTQFVDVVAGPYFTCAVLSDQTVACWGSNDHGQIGDGTMANRLHPYVIPGLTGVISISAGTYDVCT
jgi:hypothetical protein